MSARNTKGTRVTKKKYARRRTTRRPTRAFGDFKQNAAKHGTKRPGSAMSGRARKKGRFVGRRRFGGGGGGVELSRVRRRGRIGRGSKTISKGQLAKITTTRLVTRFQNIGPSDRTAESRGAFYLGPAYVFNTTLTKTLLYSGTRNQFIDHTPSWSTTVTSNFIRCPFHVYLLNSTVATQNASQLTGYQPFIDTRDGSVTFTALSTCTANGVGTPTSWQIEKTVNKGLNGVSAKYVRQDWYDIRLCLRNATQQITYFDVSLMSFKEGHLDPLELPGSVDELKDRKAFWQNMTSEGYCHPLQSKPSGSNFASKVQIHKSARYNMAPKLTIETDQDSNMKIVKWFIRDGRTYDFQYSSLPADTASIPAFRNTVLGNNQWEEQGNYAVNSGWYPKSRARRWLIVRAYDPTLASGLNGGGDSIEDPAVPTRGDTPQTTPSYDLLIRKSECMVANA